ncbi:pyridoxamine 5'-phosphate oxidase family protein [Clostridium beijerinckii]|uniref:pyridoxamine 5'-phosphate oxidase family protein n=1 Tax=Clostridium beijerinckii TaxID=1520 RepID=UPI0009CEA535|nr:pyridoxamine 5'-phosphate oxidase family protein [Clostridium beijerinckii]NRT80018.1 hypothetical protein [Clostridium beijerinckii]OOM48833.1 pyridoxamine 5'-phosphate oxidase [Clostridium beijerinckii]
MGKYFKNITDDLKKFILDQKMFVVGTAPDTEEEVYISPKGYDTLKIIDTNKVIYFDYLDSDSENETVRHLKENGKITLMWCGFDSKPRILRAYGNGKVISKGTDDFNILLNQYFSGYDEKMVKQLFEIQIEKLMTTCGFGVPIMKCEKD